MTPGAGPGKNPPQGENPPPGENLPPGEKPLLVTAARILPQPGANPTDAGAPGWVQVSGERVLAVGTGRPPAGPSQHPGDDLGDVTIVPGLVDLHCHGGAGAAFADDADAARAAAAGQHRHGTTTVMASLVTDTTAALARQVAALAPLVRSDDVAGVHLEGPWLTRAGAHDPALLRDPDPDEVDRLVDPQVVVMVTLAPERPGAMAAIRALSARGVRVALGHSDATYQVGREAIEAGARIGTHLYNASGPWHHREPGLAGALLADERVTVELIADGAHLHPAVVAEVARRAPGRFVLVSDAIAAAGLTPGDTGHQRDDAAYQLGGQPVVVRDGVARRADTGAIAGSVTVLARALRYAVQVAGLPLHAALAAVTTTPARVLGRHDIGSLRPGGYADLVALDGDLQVVVVMRRGRWLTR